MTAAHTCHAVNCTAHVPERMLMCARHWRMVPKNLQQQIWFHYRPGQEIDKNPSREWFEVAKEAIDYVWSKEADMPQPLSRTLATEYTGLRGILAQMLQQARERPGAPIRRTLRNKLRIDLMVRPGGQDLRVQLSRPGEVPPSLKEWETVLKLLPNYPTGADGGVASPKNMMRLEGREFIFDSWPLIEGDQT